MKFDTIKEAAYEWVKEFNAFPQGMISKLVTLNVDDFREITPPTVGSRVYIFDEHEYGEIADIVKYEDDSLYQIRVDNGTDIEVPTCDFDVVFDGDFLPMWGVMWQFGDSLDDYWLEEKDGLKIMADCGFRIYESDEFGYFFGIDGCGYDFYEAHWIPLYKARGLKWHNE